MPDYLWLFFRDIYEAWKGIQAVDLAAPSFILLWLFIVLLPLVGIDRRDKVAGMVYTLYCTAAGVALMLALPQNILKRDEDPAGQFFLTAGLAGVAYFRWWFKRDTVRIAEADADAIQKRQGDMTSAQTKAAEQKKKR